MEIEIESRDFLNLFYKKMGKNIQYMKCDSKIKLYLKCKSTTNKKFKNVNHFESIFDKYNYCGLKGKKQAITKKNFETPLVASLDDGKILINNTNQSIENLFMPIKIYDVSIDNFFKNVNNIYWFRRENSRNNNKMNTNFLMYLDESNKVFVEPYKCNYWFNSNTAYLS
jgi:hypothetical protein